MHSPPGSCTLRAACTVYLRGSRHSGCDLKSFFDTVNHDRLMEELRKKVRDRRVLGLIRVYLEAGVELPDDTREETLLGVPQGGPLSPLLANIILTPLDKELEARGHCFARYADDFILMVRSARAAERVMASVTRFVEEKLKLVVNRAKSRTAPLDQCAFQAAQWAKSPSLVRTAVYGPVRTVVWDPGANYSRGPDSPICCSSLLRILAGD